MSPTLFNLHGEYIMKELLDEVADFEIGGMIINEFRFGDETAILAETKN